MTDKLIEQIIADREAGTLGPWHVPNQTYRSKLTVDVTGDELIPCPGSGGAMSYTESVCTLEWSGTLEWDSNARRISRVPDMEARILSDAEALKAADELADAAHKTIHDDCDTSLVDALAAYRKAREGKA